MKKLKVTVCVVALSFAMSACGNSTNEPAVEESQSLVESSSTSIETVSAEAMSETPSEETLIPPETASSNILLNAEVKTADVTNGTGTDKIGTRAYIEVSKSDLSSISDSDYADFIDTAVKDSGNNWFSIICDDGTGIIFTGSSAEIADYGKMDTEGRVTEVIGYIVLRSGNYSYEAAE